MNNEETFIVFAYIYNIYKFTNQIEFKYKSCTALCLVDKENSFSISWVVEIFVFNTAFHGNARNIILGSLG